VPATPPSRKAAVVRDFKRAWEAQDIEALIGLLDPGATAVGDGGGLVTAMLHPVEGGDAIARHFAGLSVHLSDRTILERTVNGEPGLVIQLDGLTETVIAVEVAQGRVTHIWAVRNPEKLTPWNQ